MPIRPSGTVPATPSTTGFGYLVIIVSVAIGPGATAVSRIPKRAHSIDRTRVRFSTAARAAEECAMPGRPWCGESVTFTILPPRESGNHGPRRDRVGHQPGALDVQPDHRSEALWRYVLRRREVLPARVVHEQVDLAVALEHAVHERLHLVLLADVAGLRLHAPALRRGGGLLERLQPPPADHHLRAERRQL